MSINDKLLEEQWYICVVQQWILATNSDTNKSNLEKLRVMKSDLKLFHICNIRLPPWGENIGWSPPSPCVSVPYTALTHGRLTPAHPAPHLVSAGLGARTAHPHWRPAGRCTPRNAQAHFRFLINLDTKTNLNSSTVLFSDLDITVSRPVELDWD